MDSLLFYDFETFGSNPATCRPVQFAAFRTDLDLSPCGEPINLLCRPAADFLPSPVSVAIHGITPQRAHREGVSESEFAGVIYEAMSQPGTCAVGYNSQSFDSKVARFLFWRNLLPPYKAEYEAGCSKWDIRTPTEAAYALRPDGILWPKRESSISLRLEHLAEANGLLHAQAHDALSDVKATIALAQLIRKSQPQLFEYAFRLRATDAVEEVLGPRIGQSVLHVSPFYGYERRCVAPVFLAGRSILPEQKRLFVGVDLQRDVEPILRQDAPTLRDLYFTPASELPEGTPRPPLVQITSNAGPFVAPLPDSEASTLGLDLRELNYKIKSLSSHPELPSKLLEVFEPVKRAPSDDVDLALYDGFISRQDEWLGLQIRQQLNSPECTGLGDFDDERLRRLLPLFLARNQPDRLTHRQLQEYEQHRVLRLQAQLPTWLDEMKDDRVSASLQEDLEDWGRSILPANLQPPVVRLAPTD